MKILIVDDEAVSSYLLETMLAGRGYEVVSAGDGLEALDQLRDGSFDMIISDILMPLMDGFQLCRECRKDPTLRKTLFVFYTSTYTEPLDREFALSLGADRFIVKPMESDQFLTIIDEVIANTRRDETAVMPGPVEEEVYLKEYNERLVHKLEQKTFDLQEVNQALRESEAKYRLVVDNATDVILIVQGGAIVFVNRRAIEFSGYTADEFTQRPFIEFIHPEDRHMVREQYLKHIDKRKSQAAYSFRMIIKDGQVRWVEFHAVMIEWQGMPATLHFCTDITERHLEQEVIRKNHVTQRIINTLLHVALEDTPLQAILEKTLDLILTLPGLIRELRGCIYVVEDEPEVLVMKVQKGLDEPIRTMCARIPFGKCLCGKTARTQEVHFAWRLDDDHTTMIREMYPHGHYCVPILYAGRTHGVLNVYLPEGSQRDWQLEDSLRAVADTLAGIIIRRRAEQERSESFQKLQKALQATIRAMALIVEVRDPCTSGHQRRVANLAREIAKELGMGRDSIEWIHVAGLIHDIGKISVPTEILSKPTKLTDIEFNLIKIHAQAGYDFLREIEFPAPVPQIIYQHHERIDGSGYPAGSTGEDICREARVIAVADVVEAIASNRPNRPANNIDAALGEITQHRATLYDPGAVDACLKLFREKGFRFDID